MSVTKYDLEFETDAEGKAVEGLYQYNEVQYDKDEYIQFMSEKNTALEEQIESTQEALDFLLLSAE